MSAPAGGEQPRGERQGEGADGQADDVHADQGRHEGRVGAEAVAHDLGVGARERRQRDLRAEHGHAEEERGQLDRPLARVAIRSTSTSGSAIRRSARTNGTSAPARRRSAARRRTEAGPSQADHDQARHQQAEHGGDEREADPVDAAGRRARARPRCRTRSRRSTSVTTIAGSISSTVIDVDSTRAPEVSAPMITASSSAPTRIAAARRVSRSWRRRPPYGGR